MGDQNGVLTCSVLLEVEILEGKRGLEDGRGQVFVCGTVASMCRVRQIHFLPKRSQTEASCEKASPKSVRAKKRALTLYGMEDRKRGEQQREQQR
jgi:hypothetical protein